MNRESVNHTRYSPGQLKGHYESFFQRANHPSRPLAFWIRYTIFSPHLHPEKAIGEVWAIFFNNESGKHISVKKEFALIDCSFSQSSFKVNTGACNLDKNSLSGSAVSGNNSIDWDLQYSGQSEPLWVLPENLYDGRFPKAKLLVGLPMAEYRGKIIVNGETIEIDRWTGSQNHNWGIRHTDNYAWGQVAGFDNSPESFFEVSTARLKYGPFWTPYFTLMVLRHKGREFRLNSLWKALQAKGNYTFGQWNFSSASETVKIEGEIKSSKNNFVLLDYYNPTGGIKKCNNTKTASCKIKLNYLDENRNKIEAILETKNRAAFEILE